LRGAYVVSRNYGKKPELFLINAGFTLPNFSRKNFTDDKTKIDTRERKILAKRKEIERFLDAKKSGMSIIPTKLLTRGKYIKLVIALGKGKKLYDKRETIKRKDQQRENARIIKNIG
jgi:SsrA-binding protein